MFYYYNHPNGCEVIKNYLFAKIFIFIRNNIDVSEKLQHTENKPSRQQTFHA